MQLKINYSNSLVSHFCETGSAARASHPIDVASLFIIHFIHPFLEQDDYGASFQSLLSVTMDFMTSTKR